MPIPRSRHVALILVALSVTACNWGQRPATINLANGPEGAQVAIRLASENTDRIGELFAVDSSGLVVRDSALQRIAWRNVVAIDVAQLGDPYDLRRGQPITAEYRARLALLSRFPQGLNGSLLRAVLDRLGQAALVEVP